MFKKFLLTAALALFVGIQPVSAKTFIVASDATWPPFEMLGADKHVEGYSTDYINAIAKEVGLSVEVRNVAWDGIFAALGSNECDIIASSVTITPERSKTMSFTEPYFENYQAVVIPKAGAITTLTDLKGKKVGGQIGTTGILYVQRENKEKNLGAIVKTYDEVGLAMEDMKNGRLDAVICDEFVAKFYADKKEGYSEVLKLSFITEEVEYFGFALRKGDADLLASLNKGIKVMKEKGVDKELAKKWLN